MRLIIVALAILGLMFLPSQSLGHEENVLSPQIKGYDTKFLKPEGKIYVGREARLAITIASSSGMERGLEVQGVILEGKQKNEIFYSKAREVEPGVYAFDWKPSFAGDYIVQFVFRSGGEVLSTSFAIRVDDIRAIYAWVFGGAVALLALIIALYHAMPRKKRGFKIAPLIYALVIGAASIGIAYSVATYYRAGGEKGFVVCGAEGCVLAVHWHAQLKMKICGEPFHLPLEAGDLNKQHTHKERDKLHFHALIKTDVSGTKLLEPEKLRLGELFEQLGIRFTKECFSNYCNQEACPNGSIGKLSVLVNGVPKPEGNDYVWKDGDEIEITFG